MQDVDEQILGPTVLDDVLFAPLNYGIRRAEAEPLAREVMRRLGIEQIGGKVVHYLSGGEKKKVALAGALVLEPELLILDEPFTGLDPVSRRDLIGFLNALNREKGNRHHHDPPRNRSRARCGRRPLPDARPRQVERAGDAGGDSSGSSPTWSRTTSRSPP